MSECARLRSRRDDLEQQLVHLASGVATELHSTHSTPGYSNAGSPMRPASFSLSRRSGDAVADELRAHLSSTEDPATRATLERAEAEMQKAGAAAYGGEGGEGGGGACVCPSPRTRRRRRARR